MMALRRVNQLLLLLAMSVVLLEGIPRGKRSTEAEPWQINQNACPPALCAGPDGSSFEPSAGDACPPVLCGALTAAVRPAPPGVAFAPAAQSGGGFPFFEGDIVLNPEDRRRQLAKQHGRTKRDIIRPVTKLWRYGTVPYVIDALIDSTRRQSIETAIRTFERQTCLIFRQKTDDDEDFLTFIYQPGCWSYVGKEGGGQYVSLGPGCDSYGTVLHEMSHALGFWHEQSRPDRDKYVRVVESNIPDQYLSQFGQRDMNESSTRGYAYDYMSIMHYGKKYFSNNDKPTLRVVGIGRRLNVKIGQREQLSDIDVAQLRAMYYCNQKDQRDKVCREGWQNHGDHCYKFTSSHAHTFVQARRMCGNEGGYLANINSAEEDAYIKDFLMKFYADVETWRVGGKKNGSAGFAWLGTDGLKPMTYSNWSRGQPGRYSTLVLTKKRGASPKFIWSGAWAGDTGAQGSTRFAYPYICESEPQVPCFKSKTGDGRDYRGRRDYTESGVTCQSWHNQYPQQHKFLTGDRAVDAANGIGEHNYCRNPYGRRARPWCFTPFLDPNKPRWQYCHVSVC